MGYDPAKECIPVVPAQHYFMGGIKVNHESKTGMERLYAVGETACNGVHGRNRLASNSLLESMVFAGRAADDIAEGFENGRYKDASDEDISAICPDLSYYEDDESLTRLYRNMVREAIEKADAASSDFKEEEDYRKILESKKKS